MGLVYKISNLALRGFSIGLRFLFVFFIGKEHSLELLGDYSLWTTTIALAVILIGVDFYTVTTRHMLKASREEQWSLLRNQAVFNGLAYLLLLPLLGLIFWREVLSSDLWILFYVVVVFEHIGAEFYRLYNTLGKPIFANILLVVRNALWILVIFGWWIADHDTPLSMREILTTWSAGAGISIVIGAIYLVRTYKGVPTRPIDWAYIKNGFRASLWLVSATAALKTIELGDRYMIEHFLGKEQLGVFSFFYQITNLINVVIMTVVINLMYPNLFKALFHDRLQVKPIFNKLLKQAAGIFVSLGILVVFCTPFVIDYMEKTLLGENFNIVFYMLGASVFLNLYIAYKLFLNAWGLDKRLLSITFIGALVNLLLNFWLIPKYGIVAASFSSLVAYLILAIGTIFTTQKELKTRQIG